MDIVEELKRNPESGARRLEAEYKAGLMSLARRFCHDEGDAEELVNRTFAEVVEDIDGFLAQSSFFTWIVSILNNLHAMDCRRKSHQTVVYPGIVPDVADESAQDEIYRNIDATFVRDAVESLPKEMRDVVVMHFLMEQPIAKVAQFLSLPVSTVKWRLHIARKELARRLGATVENAAKKPGGKAVIIALLLCGLTALGAAVWHLAVPGEAQDSADAGISLVASRVSSSEAETTGHATSDTRQAETGTLSFSTSSNLPQSPSGVAGSPQRGAEGGANFSSQGENMNITQTTRAAMLAATTLAMQTALPFTASGATLTLTASDASGKSSFDTWNISGGGTEAPSSANDYVVANNRYIRVIWNRTFEGNSISFGVVGGATGQMIIQRGDSAAGHTIGFKNGGAILNNGAFRPWESNRTPTISSAGPMTVMSPEGAPFRIAAAEVTSTSFNTNNAYTIAAPVKGAAGTALMLCAGGNASLPARADTFTITGSMADFHGKLIVSGGLAGGAYEAVPVSALLYNGSIGGDVVVERNASATFESITVGGSVVVQNGAQIQMRYTDRTLTTAGLELQAGSILLGRNYSTGATGKVAVTDSLTVEPGAIVMLGTHPYVGSGTNAIDFVLLTFPASKGTIPLENFVCPDVDGFPPCSLVTNLVNGVWQLAIHKEPHDVLNANDSTDTTISKALPSALTNATSWLSGEAPRSGRMYVANAGAGGLGSSNWPVIRTPYYSNTETPFVFAGDCLALGQGGAVYPCTKDVTFHRLNLSVNTTYILSLAGVPAYLRGKLHLLASSDTYPQKIQTYMRGLNTVAAEVSGPGTLNILGRNGSGNPYGDIEFTALNTNFTGRIKVYANVTSKAASAESYCHERVFVTDARNLGGPLNAFRADALELADYSVLEARNDVDLNVANRGVKVSGNAGFAAPENVTLAISNDITWNGTARKTGDGTLALGGKPLIASGATAALSVEEGCLQVRSTNAVDGVSVTFNDGAYLLVDAAAIGDVATYGAVDLSATPFGGTLPVAFDFPGGVPEGDETLTIAVATVADAAKAQSLELSARKISEHSVEFSHRTNADGTVTILAKIYKPAFVIVIR